MIGDSSVTFKTRIPSPAAFESEGDDIKLAVPMSAACLAVNINAVDIDAVDYSDHRGCLRTGLTERIVLPML